MKHLAVIAAAIFISVIAVGAFALWPAGSEEKSFAEVPKCKDGYVPIYTIKGAKTLKVLCLQGYVLTPEGH